VTSVRTPEDRHGNSPDASSPNWRRPSFFKWLLPLPIGMCIGYALLSPFARAPSDPSGHMSGAGWGGAIGLVLALLIRFVMCRT
jgi:hypothetical protein